MMVFVPDDVTEIDCPHVNIISFHQFVQISIVLFPVVIVKYLISFVIVPRSHHGVVTTSCTL